MIIFAIGKDWFFLFVRNGQINSYIKLITFIYNSHDEKLIKKWSYYGDHVGCFRVLWLCHGRNSRKQINQVAQPNADNSECS